MTFLLNPNSLKFNNQSFSLSLTYHLLIKKTAYFPIKTFNYLPLDLKPTDLFFLYIGFELLRACLGKVFSSLNFHTHLATSLLFSSLNFFTLFMGPTPVSRYNVFSFFFFSVPNSPKLILL